MRAANGTVEVAFRQNLNLVQVDRIFGTECLAPGCVPVDFLFYSVGVNIRSAGVELFCALLAVR